MEDFQPVAVLFDMDGLILDTERIARIAWRLGGEPLGLQMTDVDYRKLIGRKLSDIEALMIESYGPEVPVKEWFAQADKHYKRMTLEEELPLMPGIHELLDLLERMQLPRAVATSTTASLARRKLERVGLLHRFQTLVGGDEVLHGKPAPDIYLQAASRLGVEISECIVLEDSEPGVMAGHSAGAKAIMIPDLVEPGEQIRSLAAAVWPSLHSVTAWLEARPNKAR